jgi:hypothetical protein
LRDLRGRGPRDRARDAVAIDRHSIADEAPAVDEPALDDA